MQRATKSPHQEKNEIFFKYLYTLMRSNSTSFWRNSKEKINFKILWLKNIFKGTLIKTNAKTNALHLMNKVSEIPLMENTVSLQNFAQLPSIHKNRRSLFLLEFKMNTPTEKKPFLKFPHEMEKKISRDAMKNAIFFNERQKQKKKKSFKERKTCLDIFLLLLPISHSSHPTLHFYSSSPKALLCFAFIFYAKTLYKKNRVLVSSYLCLCENYQTFYYYYYYYNAYCLSSLPQKDAFFQGRIVAANFYQ